MALDMNSTNGNNSGSSAYQTRRMLYRSPDDHMLGGVCGGIANYLRWDPALVRVLWVGATLVTSGAGFLVYLMLWLLLPVGTQVGGAERPAAIQFNDAMGKRLAVVLMVAGGLWLLSNLGILPGLWGGAVVLLRLAFWPLLLIAVGWMLLGRGNAGVLRARMSEWRGGAAEWTSRARTQAPSGSEMAGGIADGVDNVRRSIPLRRSRSNRMVLGVCGGIAKATGIDATLVRLVWVVLSLGSMGAGLIIYMIAGLLLPEEDTEAAPAAAAPVDTFQEVQIVDQSGTVQSGTVQPDSGSNVVHF